MPGRLAKIFDRKQTDVQDRYKCLAGCAYTNTSLAAAERVSLFSSPSYVADSEQLARIMECPNAIQPSGTFHALAFQEAMKRGLSTQRMGLATQTKIHQFGKRKAASFNKNNPTKPPREYLGYIECTVRNVRALTNSSGSRFFGVFTTPENDPAHADIFLVVKVNEGDKLQIQRLFHQIFKLANLVPAPV